MHRTIATCRSWLHTSEPAPVCVRKCFFYARHIWERNQQEGVDSLVSSQERSGDRAANIHVGNRSPITRQPVVLFLDPLKI